MRGYPDQTFTGKVERISPTADPTTRQVPIWVTVDNRSGRLVAGLFAEGRVTQASRGPGRADQRHRRPRHAADGAAHPRRQGGEGVPVRLGLLDAQNERAEIVEGLAEGDLLLTGVAQGVTPGTLVKVVDRSQPRSGRRGARAAVPPRPSRRSGIGARAARRR